MLWSVFGLVYFDQDTWQMLAVSSIDGQSNLMVIDPVNKDEKFLLLLSAMYIYVQPVVLVHILNNSLAIS